MMRKVKIYDYDRKRELLRELIYLEINTSEMMVKYQTVEFIWV